MILSNETISVKLYFVAIIFLGTLFTVVAAIHLPIRGDEPYTMITTSKGLLFALDRAVNFELQPPLYFGVLSLWRTICDTLIWARLFSVLCYSITVYVSYYLLKIYLKDSTRYLYCGLVAFNPFMIFLGGYSRGYSLLLLEIALLFILFYKVYISEDSKIIYRILFIFLSILGLYTQYFVGILLLSFGISFLIMGKFGAFKKYIIDMIVPLLSLTLLVPNLMFQIQNSVGEINLHKSIFGILYFIGARYEFYLIPIGQIPLSDIFRWSIRGIVLLLFVVSIYNLKLKKISFRNSTSSLIIITIVTTIIFAMLVNILGVSNLMAKHTIILFFPLLLLFFRFLKSLRNRPIKITWIVSLLLLYTTNIAYGYIEEENSALQKIAHFVHTNEQENQPIMLYNYRVHLEFPYFYSGPNQLIDLPHSINFNQPYNVSHWAFHDYYEIQHTLNRFVKHDTIWFVSNNPNKWFGVDFHSDLLDSCIHIRYNVDTAAVLKQYRAERLIKKTSQGDLK